MKPKLGPCKSCGCPEAAHHPSGKRFCHSGKACGCQGYRSTATPLPPREDDDNDDGPPQAA